MTKSLNPQTYGIVVSTNASAEDSTIGIYSIDIVEDERGYKLAVDSANERRGLGSGLIFSKENLNSAQARIAEVLSFYDNEEVTPQSAETIKGLLKQLKDAEASAEAGKGK